MLGWPVGYPDGGVIGGGLLGIVITQDFAFGWLVGFPLGCVRGGGL